MPSILAICDLRRRVRRRVGADRLAETQIRDLLALDPPAVLRGLRAVSAPVYGDSPEPWTIARIVGALGQHAGTRLIATAERGLSGTTGIRQLWMQSIGTAHAAQLLAAERGEDDRAFDPEALYLLGLLYRSGQWLDRLARMHDGNPLDAHSAIAELLTWHLPAAVQDAARAAAPAAAQADTRDQADSATAELLHRAERIALLAGFGAPADDATPPSAEERERIAATRTAVTTHLEAVGLDFSQPDLGTAGMFVRDTGTLGDDDQSAPHISADELTLTLLSCSGSRSYRGIVTALVAAAVRHGGYDRAVLAKWCRRRGKLILRAKFDLSARPLAATVVTPTEAEAALLRLALDSTRPQRLEAASGDGAEGDDSGPRAGLLDRLGTDEALVVPLNSEFESPAVLVLDRSLTHEPIRPIIDVRLATTIGLTGTLLIENLLLRKRAERAQKFASTDGLTRLLNRTMGLHYLDQEMARSARTGTALTLLLCDLDYFKQLNDSYGHLQGDHALRVTADVLRHTVRRSDSVSRYGGEEFLVMLPETSTAEASVLAARLHTAIENRGREIGLPLTVSIGLATSRYGDTWETILHRADQALYASKDRGRNRFSADPTEADDVEPVAATPSEDPGPSQGPTPGPAKD